MATKKLKDYTVQLKIVAVADVEIKAENFNDAVEQARALKDINAVKYKYGVNDSRVSVVGIFGGEEWDT